jgi:two-component system, LytTR family, response regulator
MPGAKRLRVLLVDDEQPARARLRQMLGADPDVEIAGEAEDGEQAIERIAELAPDLVFLDIQMPGCSGLEVAASLPSPRPRIIFCTAYDEYAVDAFELHALDYLLKPVSRARLERTLSRVRASTGTEFETSLERAAPSLAHPTRFLAKHGTRYCVVPQQEVLYFASDGGLTKLQTATQHYWMQPTLNELEARLDPARFCRVSRAAILNLDAVREVRPLPGGHGEARLSTGTIVEISRRRLKGLMERLGT